MCIQWIASANCTGAVGGDMPHKGCKGAHVAVVRREVCPSAREQCVCFFGSCGNILTLSARDQATVCAPCEVCGADEDPEQMMLLRVFDDAFAAEWVIAFGESHYEKCTEGQWRGRWAEDE
ncbi:hypothetical protein CORC01_12831 [Colletotrichum orchidophilum]|uniref:Uncharacterized protein n=1 Tax=Colletotrichum orchidophilum TaxID=1209926 RepID=A0A1G4ART9_9PEZI|nr:uncharacterized protein CORC01_12831 [Colletotrichum orchidophilum]OHE91878.1 hypothetical protein CORC01_12831 [Colletotrichum orchidophilum]